MIKYVLFFVTLVLSSINQDLWPPINYRVTLNPIIKARELEDQDLNTLITFNFEFNDGGCVITEKFKKLGWSHLFSTKKTQKLSEVLNKGRKCCDIEMCNKTNFNNFKSCCDDRKGCQDTHLYIPRVLKPSLSSVSHCDVGKLRNYYGRAYGLLNESESDWPYGSF